MMPGSEGPSIAGIESRVKVDSEAIKRQPIEGRLSRGLWITLKILTFAIREKPSQSLSRERT
jgi:hypothetical protein